MKCFLIIHVNPVIAPYIKDFGLALSGQYSHPAREARVAVSAALFEGIKNRRRAKEHSRIVGVESFDVLANVQDELIFDGNFRYVLAVNEFVLPDVEIGPQQDFAIPEVFLHQVD